MNRKTGRFLLALAVGACMVKAQLAAAIQQADAQTLLRQGKWREASRAILLEAPHGTLYAFKLPPPLASEGFVEDALHIIDSERPGVQASARLSLLKKVPTISLDTQRAIASDAIALTRSQSIQGQSRDSVAEELAQAALVFQRIGPAERAKPLFEEAVMHASAAGNYWRLTDAMLADPPSTQYWMIGMVRQGLQTVDRSLPETAFTYVSLARVAALKNDKRLAAVLVDAGYEATDRITGKGMDKVRRNSARESLAEVAANVGNDRYIAAEHPYVRAIRAARAGDLNKAASIISTLRNTLYVDHPAEAARAVFKDAVARNDLACARRFVSISTYPTGWNDVTQTRRLAEMELRLGEHDRAVASYQRAARMISLSRSDVRYFQDVEATVALAESMMTNGMQADARNAMEDARGMLDDMRPQWIEKRIRGRALVAKGLWFVGLRKMAREELLTAYRDARAFEGESDVKADVYLEVALAAASFGHPSGL